MSLEKVMNAGGDVAHGSGSVISGGVFSVLASPSSTVEAVGEGIIRGLLLFTFSGGNVSGFDSGSVVGYGRITPSTVLVHSVGQAIIREGDSVQMTATGTIGGVPTPVAGNTPVEVSEAGQDKVEAQ